MKILDMIFPILRNYKTNKNVDKEIRNLLENQVESVEGKRCYTTILFSNKSVMSLWTRNKFYAYAHKGVIHNKEGLEFKWDGMMPSRLIVKKIHKLITTPSYQQSPGQQWRY